MTCSKWQCSSKETFRFFIPRVDSTLHYAESVETFKSELLCGQGVLMTVRQLVADTGFFPGIPS